MEFAQSLHDKMASAERRLVRKLSTALIRCCAIIKALPTLANFCSNSPFWNYVISCYSKTPKSSRYL